MDCLSVTSCRYCIPTSNLSIGYCSNQPCPLDTIRLSGCITTQTTTETFTAVIVNDSTGKPNSIAVIVGIVIAVIVCVALLAAIATVLIRHKRQHRERENQGSPSIVTSADTAFASTRDSTTRESNYASASALLETISNYDVAPVAPATITTDYDVAPVAPAEVSPSSQYGIAPDSRYGVVMATNEAAVYEPIKMQE